MPTDERGDAETSVHASTVLVQRDQRSAPDGKACTREAASAGRSRFAAFDLTSVTRFGSSGANQLRLVWMVMIALGIAAATSLFSVVNGVLSATPMDVRRPSRPRGPDT